MQVIIVVGYHHIRLFIGIDWCVGIEVFACMIAIIAIIIVGNNWLSWCPLTLKSDDKLLDHSQIYIFF